MGSEGKRQTVSILKPFIQFVTLKIRHITSVFNYSKATSFFSSKNGNMDL